MQELHHLLFPGDIAKILQIYYFGYFGHAWLRTPKRFYQLEETFVFNCTQKIILQRYANFLFWVLWACLVTQAQNDSINLQKTSMSICMPKGNFLIHFFRGILHFKESCNFMANSILAHNTRTRILPVMGLVVKYQQQYQFSFQINSRKN